MHKSKYLAIHPNKCGPQDSLGIDYHWCGNGRGGTPNVELQFDPTTGNLVGVVFIPNDGLAAFGEGPVERRVRSHFDTETRHDF